MVAPLGREIRSLNRITETDAKLCHTVTTRPVVYLLFQLQLRTVLRHDRIPSANKQLDYCSHLIRETAQ